MASYRTLTAYGPNPNAGVNVNADHGWGGYQYPGGVPNSLLGAASYNGVTTTVRRELVELFSLAYQLAKQKHGYTIYTRNPNGNGENWGPWGYENRVIAGSNTPSNHSKAKANDWNAPYNPYSVSNFASDFPPAMVADLESIGLGWGGRYGDTMHWEYAYSPADVAGHVARARALLGGKAVGTVDKPAGLTPAQLEEIEVASAVEELINRLPGIVQGVVNDSLRAPEFNQTAAAELARINSGVIDVFRGDEFKGIIRDQVLKVLDGPEVAAKINGLVVNVFRSPEVAGIIDRAADGKVDNGPKA